jgi:hypothetical protein
MRSIRITLGALGSLLLPASAIAAGDPSDYVGRWELVIANSGTTFRSCALNLSEEKDQLKGDMVWRWGSVFPVGEKDTLSLNEKGELQIRYGDWKGPLTLRRVGDALEGSVTLKDGSTHDVFGTLDEEAPELAGDWDVTVKVENEEHGGTLRLRRGEKGALSAEAVNREGKNVPVEDFGREGRKVHFTLIPDSSKPPAERPHIEAEVRGDRITGKVVRQGSDHPLEGSRKRVWGPPVSLLESQGLKGWRPREKSKKFGWKCEDGVLTNSEQGDIDILSEEKFKDFQLHLEFKVAPHGNSGVYLRGRYEVQIQDDYGKPTEPHGMGAIYSRIAPRINASKPADSWQTYDITLVGRWVTVKLNGETVIDNGHLDGITGGAVNPFESQPGPLMLQGDHGKVWFRNITVQEAQ